MSHDNIYEDQNASPIEQKIDKLEERIANLEKNKYVQRVQYFGNKKPHKCPNCDFTGAILLENMDELERFKTQLNKTDDGRYFIWCHSCEGTGIVWS